MLASTDAFRNGDVQRVLFRKHAPLRIDVRNSQRDGARCAVVRVFEIDQHARVTILPLRMKRTACATSAAETAAPEQRFEKVAELGRIAAGEAAAFEFETGVPVRRRAELLSL